MSVFKVGQRVARKESAGCAYIPSGSTGTIVGPSDMFDWCVLWDHELPSTFGVGYWWHTPADAIRPLTDPRANAFMESMRNLKPLELESI